MRDVDPLERRVLDELSVAHDKVSHEVDGDDLHRRQVGVAVGDEELEHLVLALVLGRELLGVDPQRIAFLNLVVLALHLCLSGDDD